jgi:hypothetical protein
VRSTGGIRVKRPLAPAARRARLSLEVIPMFRRALFIVVLVPLASACHDRLTTEPARAPVGPSLAVGQGVPDRYIVVLRPGIQTASSVAVSVVAQHGAQVHHVYEHALNGFAATLSPSAVEALRRDARVERLEADQIVSTLGSQTPAPSWGLDRVDQRSNPRDDRYTWNATGSNVHAYIIDTGIRVAHSDFGGRAAHAFDAIDGTLPAQDCHGHGTHVAGIVGGTTYGVAKSVQLRAVRVLDCSGSGLVSQVIAGLNWVTANAVKPAVANMSLGGAASPTLDQAVTNSINSGVFYVVAAGNSGSDACNFSPARTALAHDGRGHRLHRQSDAVLERGTVHRRLRAGSEHQVQLEHEQHGHTRAQRDVDGSAARGRRRRSVPAWQA